MINNDKPNKNLLSESTSNNIDEQISFGDEEKLKEKSSEKKMITVTFDANKLDQLKNQKSSYSNQKNLQCLELHFPLMEGLGDWNMV